MKLLSKMEEGKENSSGILKDRALPRSKECCCSWLVWKVTLTAARSAGDLLSPLTGS